VRDRAPVLPASIELESVFDATPLADAQSDPWPVLDCPLGRAQLLIDCALDVQAPDGAIDCVVGGTSALVADVEATRGMPDPAGCRPDETVGGTTSLDATLDAAIGAPWPTGADLAAFLAARRAPLTSFTLTSRLEGGDHRLDQLATGGYSIDLVNSDRAVIRQVAPLVIDAVSGQAVIGEHRFTVDYGRFARAAFSNLGLDPAGLADRADDLGAALYQSVASGAENGCQAFSEIVCSAIERVESCLAVSCSLARPELDGLLDSWWRALEASGFDFALSGAAAIADPDGDLAIDSLQGGTWAAEIALESGGGAGVSGSWSGGD
jgi:hypothetical protein